MKKVLFAAVFARPAPDAPFAQAQQPNMVGATNADPLAQSGRAFAQAVYMNDKFEILAGRMALEKGSPAVRDFGQDMIAAHTESSEDLKAILGTMSWADRLTPPPVLDPRHMADVSRAGNLLAGGTFDRIYLAQQRDVHEEALDVMRGYVENGRVDDLQDFAHHMVPIVQDHLGDAAQRASEVAAN